ncbi:MAG: anti-sigma factor [Verrucomicrobiota bacterium]|nr:anti-sigma factor [Verrucomicrobiota bacterium]
MIDEATQETAALYALDLLDPEPARAFETRLSGDAELRRLVEELRESGAALANTLAPVAPPSALREKVLSSAQSPPRLVPMPPAKAPWLPWALAASFAIACSYFVTEWRRVNSEFENLASQRAAWRREYEEAVAAERRAAAEKQQLEQERTQLTAEKEALSVRLAEAVQRDALAQVRIASLTGQVNAYARAVAVVVWDPQKQRGIARFDRLPQPEANKVYQLWVIDPTQPVPVSGGLLPAGPTGSLQVAFKPARAINSAGKFAVSIEAAGGATAPAGPIVLVGE